MFQNLSLPLMLGVVASVCVRLHAAFTAFRRQRRGLYNTNYILYVLIYFFIYQFNSALASLNDDPPANSFRDHVFINGQKCVPPLPQQAKVHEFQYYKLQVHLALNG